MQIDMDLIKDMLPKVKHLNNDFTKYGKVYLFTTENINGIMSKININNKDVLAVAGSGDQALNAFYNGAKSVTLFDINPLAYAQVELKVTAARILPYQKFLEYFSTFNSKILNVDTYNQIRKYLKEDVLEYYDFLYANFNPSEIFLRTVQRFFPFTSKLESINDYMGEENYLYLQNILENKDINYIESNLIDLPSKLNQKYDAILLSNISDSLEDIWDTDTLLNYKRYIYSLSKYLNDDGVIQCGYIYSDYETQKRVPIFTNNEEREKVLASSLFKEYEIVPYDYLACKDKIITFTKKRKVA